MNNIKKTVSIYYNAKDANSQETMTIDEVIELIRKDSCIISELTEKVRNAVDEKEYKELKKQLPMFAGSGIFRYRNDNPDNLIEYSNLLVIDFDHFHDYQKVIDFRSRLIQYADYLHLYAIWISPSNDGIKAVMIHDNQEPSLHYNLFCQVKKNLYPRTGEFDMNCSDITRTCFICHDPDIWVNPGKDEIEPYHFVYDPSIPMPGKKTYSSSNNNGKVCSSEFIHTPEERKVNSMCRFQNEVQRFGL